MSVTKTQGSFPDDGSDSERRSGPSAHQAAPADAAIPESAEAAVPEPPPADALTGLPDRLAAAGRAAGRLIEAIAGPQPQPQPETDGAGEEGVEASRE